MSSDLEFVLQGGVRVLTKHKRAIFRMSEVIKEGLQQQELENGTTAFLNLAELGVEDFKVFEKFLSTEILPEDLTINNCLKLLEIATTYDMTILLAQLIAKIKALMKKDNVFQVVEVAKYRGRGYDELYTFAIEFISQRPLVFIYCEEFLKLDGTEVEAILDSEHLDLRAWCYSEVPVFLSALGWAKYHTVERQPEMCETYYFFKKVAHCVRFPLLGAEKVKYLLEEYACEFDEDLTLMLKELITGMTNMSILPIAKKYNIKWWMRGKKGKYFLEGSKEKGPTEEETLEPNLAKSFAELNNPGASDNQMCSSIITSNNDSDELMETNIETCEDNEVLNMQGIKTELRSEDEDQVGSKFGNLDQTTNSNIVNRNLTPVSSPQESVSSVTNMLERMKTSPLSSSVTDPKDLASPRRVGPLDHEDTEVTQRPILRPTRKCSATFAHAKAPNCTSSKQRVSFQEEDDDDVNSDSSDELLYRNAKNRCSKYSSYPALVAYSCRNNETKEQIGTVELTQFRIKTSRKSISVSDNATITVDGTCDQILGVGEDVDEVERLESLLRFIRSFNLLDWLVFKPSSLQKLSLTVTDIWNLRQNVSICLNGITFFKIDHREKEIVTNCLKDSAEILGRRTRARSIAISNCEFNLKLEQSSSKLLEKLNLYRVWGDFTLHGIFACFPNLRELRVWKWMPNKNEMNQFPEGFSTLLKYELSNPHFQYETLKILRLSRVEIVLCKFSQLQSTNVEELSLERCRTRSMEKDVGLCQVIPTVFPKLKRLTLVGIEEEDVGHIYDALSVHSIVGAAQMPTLEWLRCTNIKWNYYDTLPCTCDLELQAFFNEADVGQSTNFLMEREIRSVITNGRWQEAGWNVTCYMESQRKDYDEYLSGGYCDMCDQLEYADYELEKFFKNVTAFQCYFINENEGENRFPKHILTFF